MRQEGYDDGIAVGIAEEIEKMIKSARNFGVSKIAACEQLVQQYALEESEANEKIGKYWGD